MHNSNIITIHGYKNSTAQAYAEKYVYKFEALDEETAVKGDANGDGKLNVRDAAAIANYLAKGKNK